MPSFDLENQLQGLVGGVDEVGRGPWAGPVVAAVAVFHQPENLSPFLKENIQDSKRLSKEKRIEIAEALKEVPHFSYSIGMASVDEIDQLNILQATFLAMKRATQELPASPDHLLIDGKMMPSLPNLRVHPVIKGDSLSYSIAAASILAKVTRDTLMEILAQEYPHYGWERNAGYGTAEHQKALALQGVTIHHRKSFAPIKALLNLHE